MVDIYYKLATCIDILMCHRHYIFRVVEHYLDYFTAYQYVICINSQGIMCIPREYVYRVPVFEFSGDVLMYAEMTP